MYNIAYLYFSSSYTSIFRRRNSKTSDGFGLFKQFLEEQGPLPKKVDPLRLLFAQAMNHQTNTAYKPTSSGVVGKSKKKGGKKGGGTRKKNNKKPSTTTRLAQLPGSIQPSFQLPNKIRLINILLSDEIAPDFIRTGDLLSR
jgi:hypothetical protein